MCVCVCVCVLRVIHHLAVMSNIVFCLTSSAVNCIIFLNLINLRSFFSGPLDRTDIFIVIAVCVSDSTSVP